jgi:wobble nucleotide-excising tRNase
MIIIHHYLNEAKLSAIALSIFFAALKLQPVSRLRVLALDDVLIGLDMANRMPVLEIIDQHFSNYQVFFFTYDNPWFEVVKRR